jgi:hypothetical protein
MYDREPIEEIKAALSDPCGVAARLGLTDGARRQAGGIHVKCPAHDDRSPSCSLTRGRDGRLRVSASATTAISPGTSSASSLPSTSGASALS